MHTFGQRKEGTGRDGTRTGGRASVVEINSFVRWFVVRSFVVRSLLVVFSSLRVCRSVGRRRALRIAHPLSFFLSLNEHLSAGGQ